MLGVAKRGHCSDHAGSVSLGRSTGAEEMVERGSTAIRARSLLVEGLASNCWTGAVSFWAALDGDASGHSPPPIDHSCGNLEETSAGFNLSPEWGTGTVAFSDAERDTGEVLGISFREAFAPG
ncbi:hypothetical protein GCM10027024_27850 [Microbacterium insulae]